MAISIGTKIAGAALAGAVALGAGAVAWAANGTARPSASTSTLAADTVANLSGAPAAGGTAGAAGRRVGRGALALLRRADHGDLEVREKGSQTWETVTFDRGKVGDVAADHIALARPDGQSVTLKIDSSTAFHGVGSWQDVRKGEPAIVISKDGTATQVFQRRAAAPAGNKSAAPAAPAA